MRIGHYKRTYADLLVLSDSAAVWSWITLLLLVLVSLPFWTGNYSTTIATSTLISVVGAVGLHILTGMTGQISLAQSGFLAVGAYANAILIADHHWQPLLSVPAAGLVTAALSLLVGVPALRLKGLYLAITTLAFSFIVSYVVLYAEPLTHGPSGLFLPDVFVFGAALEGRTLYWFVLACTVLAVVATLNLKRTRVGRAWLAIRDHDIAARVMGVDLTSLKLLAFVASSFLVGVAGALISLQIRFINIDVFGLLLSIEALAMLIFGGMGSIAGAILGAVALSLLPEAIRILLGLFGGGGSASMTSTGLLEMRGIVYGIAIILFLRFKPDGLIGFWRDIVKYWSQWPLAR